MSDAEAKAAHAQRLIEDPMLQEAFSNVRTAAIEAWARSHTDETVKREQAFWTVRMLDLLRNELDSIIAGGKIAASRLQNPPR